MGADPSPPASGTLAGYAAHVARTAETFTEPPIVVGHSLGGATITQAGELAADAIRGLVYLAAMLIPNGVSIASMAENGLFVAPDPAMRMLPAPEHDGCVIVPPEDIISFLYHRSDAEGQALALAKCGPQPFEPIISPITTTEERWGRLPRAFIECLDDRIVTLESQRRAQARLPCDPVIAIDSDHSPFISAPESLAAALTKIAERWSL